jgi:hypothetical protein
MTGGENMKERGYLVPKTKIDRLGDNEIYFNISKISLKEFEIWLYLTRIIHLSYSFIGIRVFLALTVFLWA